MVQVIVGKIVGERCAKWVHDRVNIGGSIAIGRDIIGSLQAKTIA
jgi:hypothetical protein